MGEKLQALWQVIEPRLRIIIFVLLGVLLAAVFYLKSSEKSRVMSPEIPPGGGAGMKAGNGERSESSRKVEESLYGEVPPIEKSQFAPLVTHDMFNVKAIESAIQQEAEATQKYEEAAQLFTKREYIGALDLVKRCLEIWPSHRKAKELQKELKKKLESTRMGAGGSRSNRSAAPSPPSARTTPLAPPR